MGAMYHDEKGKFYTEKVAKDMILATIQTTTHRIRGYIHIRINERLKNELDRDEPFMAVTNAVVFDQQGEILYRHEFIAVRKTHIVWVMPDDQAFNPQSEESAG
jgi:hypothetical protein